MEILSQNKPISFLYSALDNYGGHPFHELFDVTTSVYGPEDLISPKGALVVWGGGDISPSIYGQKPNSKTGAEISLSQRDRLELALTSSAIKQNIPIIGICRGAQLLCAQAGGSLVQHVTGHGTDHSIVTNEGKKYQTTSLHHQIMFPWKLDAKKFQLLAWTDPLLSNEYLGEDDINIPFDGNQLVPPASELNVESEFDIIEPEIIYFPELKALCIQGHPEFIHNRKHEFVKYCLGLVDEYIKPHII
jgi:GMP synthase-like glutamine amidotransferase